jgi:hypothetical protein
MERMLIGALAVVVLTVPLAAGKKPVSSPGLETVHESACDGGPCVLLPDSEAPYVGGQDSVVVELAQGAAYKMTIYAASGRWVDVTLSGDGTCTESAPGTLRFLRVDGIGNLASGESMMTTAYAQINGPDGLIWNLYWGTNGTESVRAERSADGTTWTINTTGGQQAFIERPSGRRWAPCGTSTASFSFTTRLQGN